MTSTDQTYCGDGYECLTGAKSAAPWGGVEGQLCPAGKKCQRLVAGPTDCDEETYNPDLGRSSCNYCPEGRLCMLVDYAGAATTNWSVDRTTPDDCTAGYYCPAA
jgi:hypothetical protein